MAGPARRALPGLRSKRHVRHLRHPGALPARSSTTPASCSRMGDAIVHRGPDDEGTLQSTAQVLLGMRRLSIIDVAGGHQPITNEDGIGGRRVQRRDLQLPRAACSGCERAGHRFATHSDTEVIVHLYEERGEEFLDELDGMFGLAVWDRASAPPDRRSRPVSASNRSTTDDGSASCVFASEAKALLRIPGVRRGAGSGPRWRSTWRSATSARRTRCSSGMRKLPPGSALIVGGRPRARSRRYWTAAAGSRSLDRPSAAVDRGHARRDGASRARPDGERRADRRVPERRPRFERGRRVHDVATASTR